MREAAILCAATFIRAHLPHMAGGFCLRSRSKTLEVLDKFGYCRGQCEDVFYAEHIPKV